MAVFVKTNAPTDVTAESAVSAASLRLVDNRHNLMDEPIEMEITTRSFGTTQDGREVQQFICKNSNGYVLEVIDYGATVTGFGAPDQNGLVENITLSCSDIEGYETCKSYFGSTVGRYCNRISQGKFSIDGHDFTLATNDGVNHLHGGKIGFDKQIWDASKLINENSVGIRFTLVSKDSDEGYPGELTVTVDYVLNNANELSIDFSATTTQPTHVNLTNHNYWNLGGVRSGTILDHELKLESDQYIPVDATAIPTGALNDVAESAFDFREYQRIGSRIEQIKSTPVGYDHCYVLKSQNGQLALAATVVCPKSGRKMEIHTTQPGIQFYTGNFLDGQPGSGGFDQYSAFCLETQHYPDSPNQPSFPKTLLKPGETFRQSTVHKFFVE